jgi:putative endonuclease
MNRLAQFRISCFEGALRGLDWLAQKRGRTTDLAAHLETGFSGEDAAYFYLRRKGYTVVARRWSSKRWRGDLDLVAWKEPFLCIVEVKTRTAHDLIPAEFAVDAKKRDVLRRLARQYVRQLPAPQPPPVRFDVISVYLVPGEEKEFHHFEGSFGWSEQDDWDRWDR